MPLELYYHPLSSFCHKALIALYENDTPFERHALDLQDPAQRAALTRLYPISKFPVLRDTTREQTVVESTTIVEYLALHYPGRVQLVPGDAEQALEVRLRDRIFDLYLQLPMQKIVGDRIRPEGHKDPHGVEEARKTLDTAVGLVDEHMRGRVWAVGDSFTMADCAAAPALLFADKVAPLLPKYSHAAAYFGRLKERSSFARVLAEAQPYFAKFPT